MFIKSTKPLLNFVFINNGTLSNGTRNDPYIVDLSIIKFAEWLSFILELSILSFSAYSLHNIISENNNENFPQEERTCCCLIVCLQRIEHSNVSRFLNSHLSYVAHFKIGTAFLRNYDHHVPNDAWYNEQTRNENNCRLSICFVVILMFHALYTWRRTTLQCTVYNCMVYSSSLVVNGVNVKDIGNWNLVYCVYTNDSTAYDEWQLYAAHIKTISIEFGEWVANLTIKMGMIFDPIFGLTVVEVVSTHLCFILFIKSAVSHFRLFAHLVNPGDCSKWENQCSLENKIVFNPLQSENSKPNVYSTWNG